MRPLYNIYTRVLSSWLVPAKWRPHGVFVHSPDQAVNLFARPGRKHSRRNARQVCTTCQKDGWSWHRTIQSRPHLDARNVPVSDRVQPSFWRVVRHAGCSVRHLHGPIGPAVTITCLGLWKAARYKDAILWSLKGSCPDANTMYFRKVAPVAVVHRKAATPTPQVLSVTQVGNRMHLRHKSIDMSTFSRHIP